jgi:soluble lytic murein transglycosylase-like protein
MKFPFALTLLATFAAALTGWPAQAQQRSQYEALIATHAQANLVPDALVHRVIVRESKYQPNLIGRGGAIGLMQIKLPTARSLGYKGDAAGLRDPETNLTYGIKYLAGAYRAAGGNHDRAVRYYASGYYYAAKQQRLQHLREAKAKSNSTFAAASQKEQAQAEGPEDAGDADAQQLPGN